MRGRPELGGRVVRANEESVTRPLPLGGKNASQHR
jgi:hypothetical protein